VRQRGVHDLIGNSPPQPLPDTLGRNLTPVVAADVFRNTPVNEQVTQPLENVFAREPLGDIDRQALPSELVTIRVTRRGSSSGRCRCRRCVFRCCPSARHARRSLSRSRPRASFASRPLAANGEKAQKLSCAAQGCPDAASRRIACAYRVYLTPPPHAGRGGCQARLNSSVPSSSLPNFRVKRSNA
jgi:hypothetical protein